MYALVWLFSSQEMTMIIFAELKDQNGQSIAILTLPPKEFKTGSKGYYANAKTVIDGKSYQIQVQLVEVGSKKPGQEKGTPSVS